MIENWVVRVYDVDDSLIESWKIRDRNESEAFKEAEADINRSYPGYDWTLTRLYGSK